MKVSKEPLYISFETIYDTIYMFINDNKSYKIVDCLKYILNGNFDNATLKSVLVSTKSFKSDKEIFKYREEIKQTLESRLGEVLV